MDMDVPVYMGIGNLPVIDFRKPVIGSHCAGIVQNQPANRICDGGIFLDAPVLHLYVVIHHILIVKDGLI